MLISGFNTLPEREREKYDKARMSRDQRNLFFSVVRRIPDWGSAVVFCKHILCHSGFCRLAGSVFPRGPYRYGKGFWQIP